MAWRWLLLFVFGAPVLHGCRSTAALVGPAPPTETSVDTSVPVRPSSLPPVAVPPSEAPPNPERPGCWTREHLKAIVDYGGTDGALAPSFVDDALSYLWSAERATREAGPLSKDIVSALGKRRYGVVAKLIGAQGVCLRAAKGAACRKMSARELSACGSSHAAEEWAEDTGADTGPRYTCDQAFRRIFLRRDFSRGATVTYNCLPEPSRGNNSAGIVTPPPARAYVEYRLEESGEDERQYQPWRALWLVFDDRDGTLRLTEMISEYWGI